jgi:hypothetical protein
MTVPILPVRQGGTGLTSLSALPISTAQQAALDLKADKSQLATPALQRFSVADGNLTIGQTTFTVSAYTPGTVMVFMNGNKVPANAYTATNGTTVVLVDAALASDVIEIMSWLTSGVQNAAPISHQHSTADLTGPALSQALGGTGATSLGAATFLSTGSTIARAVADRSAETANLLDFFQAGDADWTNAFNRALASGRPVEVPYNDGVVYNVSGNIIFPNGGVIRGKGKGAKRPTIRANGSSQRVFTMQGGITNAVLEDVIIIKAVGVSTANPVLLDGVSYCRVSRVRLDNCTSALKVFNGAFRNIIEDVETISSGLHGIHLDGPTTTQNIVTRLYAENNVVWGVGLTAGTNENEISFCRTYSNGAELVGVTRDCYGNRIIGNHAEGCGDNGISVTGYGNVVQGNECRRNLHNGICIYGYRNSVTGNVCANNGTNYPNDSVSWAGIAIRPEFGGQAWGNVVTGNSCYDDQATPTQAYGTWIMANAAPQWVASTSWSSKTPYCWYGLNAYALVSGTATGTTPPTHTSGTVSDGGVTWQYIFSTTSTFDAHDNVVGPNVCSGNIVADRAATTLAANAEHSASVLRHVVPGAGKAQQIFVTGNTPPNNNLLGYAGDMAIRNNGSANLGLWWKEADGTTTSWVPFQARRSGVAASRPSSLIIAGLEGSEYYNTDTSKPEFSSGSAWVDGLGRKADPDTSLTAAGTDQSTALQLNYAHSSVSTVAAGTGVILPTTRAGREMKVFNRGANALNVYPPVGSQINALATNAPFVLAAGTSASFVALTGISWGT